MRRSYVSILKLFHTIRGRGFVSTASYFFQLPWIHSWNWWRFRYFSFIIYCFYLWLSIYRDDIVKIAVAVWRIKYKIRKSSLHLFVCFSISSVFIQFNFRFSIFFSFSIFFYCYLFTAIILVSSCCLKM